MPYGRGWFGWGGWGPGRGRGYLGALSGWGIGMGRGNPYPFCRFYPWLPRRWWMNRPHLVGPSWGYGPAVYDYPVREPW